MFVLLSTSNIIEFYGNIIDDLNKYPKPTDYNNVIFLFDTWAILLDTNYCLGYCIIVTTINQNIYFINDLTKHKSML